MIFEQNMIYTENGGFSAVPGCDFILGSSGPLPQFTILIHQPYIHLHFGFIHQSGSDIKGPPFGTVHKRLPKPRSVVGPSICNYSVNPGSFTVPTSEAFLQCHHRYRLPDPQSVWGSTLLRNSDRHTVLPDLPSSSSRRET